MAFDSLEKRRAWAKQWRAKRHPIRSIPAPAEDTFPQVEGVRFANVVGHPGYCVGDDGSVWSRWKRFFPGGQFGYVTIIQGEWKRMKLTAQGTAGHLKVILKDRQNHSVHRLVLFAFVGLCPEGMECLHRDGNASNNHLTNLRWGTKKENGEDSVKHGTSCRGSKNCNAKLSEELVPVIRNRLAKGEKPSAIAKELGVSKGTIVFLRDGITWKHVSPTQVQDDLA